MTDDRHARTVRQYDPVTTANTDVTKGLLMLALTEESVRLQCQIDALYWTLAHQGHLKAAVRALRAGQIENQQDRERKYGK